MIIVSQDGTKIYNFDRINYIELDKGGDMVAIECNYADDNYGETLSYYETEERAKEVLNEIVQEYSKYIRLEGGPAVLQGQSDIAPNIFNIPKVYVMPKEWLYEIHINSNNNYSTIL